MDCKCPKTCAYVLEELSTSACSILHALVQRTCGYRFYKRRLSVNTLNMPVDTYPGPPTRSRACNVAFAHAACPSVALIACKPTVQPSSVHPQLCDPTAQLPCKACSPA
eukprot:1152171-Pelagomonas_calceolata.AAC.5